MIVTASPPMRSRVTEPSHRALRWLTPAALVALAPKCVLCVAAYVGLGSALGVGGPELCGAPAGTAVAWTTPLAGLGLAGGLGALVARLRCGRGSRRRRATAGSPAARGVPSAGSLPYVQMPNAPGFAAKRRGGEGRSRRPGTAEA